MTTGSGWHAGIQFSVETLLWIGRIRVYVRPFLPFYVTSSSNCSHKKNNSYVGLLPEWFNEFDGLLTKSLWAVFPKSIVKLKVYLMFVSTSWIFLQKVWLIIYLYSFKLKLWLSHNHLTQSLIISGVCCVSLRYFVFVASLLVSFILWNKGPGQCCHLVEKLISAKPSQYACVTCMDIVKFRVLV